MYCRGQNISHIKSKGYHGDKVQVAGDHSGLDRITRTEAGYIGLPLNLALLFDNEEQRIRFESGMSVEQISYHLAL